MAKHLLSKSTFMYGVQCPLRLYLHKFKSQLKNPQDDSKEAIFTTGTNVGVLAQRVFPGGIDVTPPDAFSYTIAAQKTQRAIQDGANVIYEATFYGDELMCAVDILIKKNGHWYAYEVKSTLDAKDQHKLDAAFQYYVMEKAGVKIKDFFIMHLNRDYVRRGELDYNSLFKATSVMDEVMEYQPTIKHYADLLKPMLKNKEVPKIEPSNHCFKPYECDFTNHCWKGIQEEEDTTEYPNILDKPALQNFLDNLQYPIYFFDFETVNHAVPVYNKSRPFQQIPFQYSLHVLKDKDAEIEHRYFLGDGINDPREELIKQMLNDVGEKGTILAWYLPFESKRLEELMNDFPDYATQIESLFKRMDDLYIPFKKRMYRLPEFKNSSSIKDVLPVLVPELSYKELQIQEGGTASLTYATLADQLEEEQIKLKKALLDYCHLDTLAMVRIFEILTAL